MARPRRWLPAILILLSIAIIPLVLVGSAAWRADEALERADRENREEIARRTAAGVPRPVLLGDPLPGNARDHYSNAVARLKGLPAEQLAILRAAREEREPPPAHAGAAFRPVAEEILRALRCARFAGDPEYDQGFGVWRGYLLHDLGPGLLAWTGANAAAGNDGETLRLLVSLIGLSHDRWRIGDLEELTGHWGDELSAAPIARPLLARHALTPEELQAACAALDRLEDAWPTAGERIRVQRLLERIELVQCYRDPEGFRWTENALPSWRHLGLLRLKLVESLNDLERDYRAFDEIDRLPFHERPAAARRRVDAAAPDRLNGTDLLVYIPWVYQLEALRRMEFTLFRIALALAWHERERGEFPQTLERLLPRYLRAVPPCPLTGAPFRHVSGRVWSIGSDGDDDGGRPLPENAGYLGDGDVVWTVRRRSP
jgi:hypothetical protein